MKTKMIRIDNPFFDQTVYMYVHPSGKVKYSILWLGGAKTFDSWKEVLLFMEVY